MSLYFNAHYSIFWLLTVLAATYRKDASDDVRISIVLDCVLAVAETDHKD